MAATQPQCTLSICISTLNRAGFIGATLRSIIGQATDQCEIVVVDGASTDDTAAVVSECSRTFSRMRYVRLEKNNGLDRDYDHAVVLARGEYCWLMSDDDILMPGAVDRILQATRAKWSLMVIDVEYRDFSVSYTIQRSLLQLSSDRIYQPRETDRLVCDTSPILPYIGSLIFRRSLWLTRTRERYYGSLFLHVGVLFQKRLPDSVLVLAEPCILFRSDNAHTFSPRLFETFMFRWPEVVWSLEISERAKREISRREPWKNVWTLLFWRALGYYSPEEYERLIRPRLSSRRERMLPYIVTIIPGYLANTLVHSYYSLIRPGQRAWLNGLRQSRFYLWKPRLRRLSSP